MTPEVIATMIASIGAIMAALWGIYKASKSVNAEAPVMKSDKDIPKLIGQYIESLTSIEKSASQASTTLRDIRRALEGTGPRQEKMVEELENLARSMNRIENAQSSAGQVAVALKHHQELQVTILSQIREEIKNLREQRWPPHRTE